ncbi:hypothetical protein HL658_09995 [Azospirillum sp. RWY-5-1]|uniref:Mu-like prophage FluMu N-terminal domain-containing protein n=1 Tax=Azospirillum oleiclasticum TaxID=2735135 RepID=A0ABX2TA74_9PROT|nr:HI1506-related protein [Azospirillum oleiclasticum]NYZ12883.1 hypothetical protein [Azospirillum oleiclasticum]NYZ20043.1 hypothetical protein [Azospirillum oleiclasticum]
MAALMDSPFMGRLRITARPAKGFRRAGVHHPASAVEHPPGTFTVAQVWRLGAERLLTVELLESPPATVAPDDGSAVAAGADTDPIDTGDTDTGAIVDGPRPNDPSRMVAETGTTDGAAATDAAAPPAPRGDGGAAAPHTTPADEAAGIEAGAGAKDGEAASKPAAPANRGRKPKAAAEDA